MNSQIEKTVPDPATVQTLCQTVPPGINNTGFIGPRQRTGADLVKFTLEMETGQKEKKLKPWTDYQGRIQYTSTAVA
jgi:hypothetical protein